MGSSAFSGSTEADVDRIGLRGDRELDFVCRCPIGDGTPVVDPLRGEELPPACSLMLASSQKVLQLTAYSGSWDVVAWTLSPSRRRSWPEPWSRCISR